MRKTLILAVGLTVPTLGAGCAKMSHWCGQKTTTVCAPVTQGYCAPACAPACAPGCLPGSIPVTSGTATYLTTPTIQTSPDGSGTTFSPGPENYTPTPAGR